MHIEIDFGGKTYVVGEAVDAAKAFDALRESLADKDFTGVAFDLNRYEHCEGSLAYFPADALRTAVIRLMP